MPVVHELQVVSAEPSVVSAQATTASPTPSQKTTNTTLPIGVIAGSIAGGVALAAVFVVAWTYWGKAFQRRQRKQACTVFTTRDNIRRRSSCRRKRPFSIRSQEKLHLDCKDSAESVNEKTDAYYDRKTKVTTPDAVEFTTSSKSSTTRLVPSKPTKLSPSPRMLRKHRRRTQSIEKMLTLSSIIDGDASLSPPPAIIHKPSIAGSSSIYSTQSGEERQFDVPPNFLLPELGPPDIDCPISRPPISHKPSNVSSVYSNQSGEERIFGVSPNFLVASGRDRMRFSATRSSVSMYSIAHDQSPPSAWATPLGRNTGGANGPQPSRLSQVSCPSMYSRTDNQSTVGIAYGGEDGALGMEINAQTDCRV